MAKVVFTADLHYCSRVSSNLELLAAHIRSRKPDAVVLAGDIGEPFFYFEEALDLFRCLKCPVGVVAGNHDVWVTDRYSRHTSSSLFNKLLPSAVRKRGFTWLEEDSIILKDGTAIAGSIAWYDYSYRSPTSPSKDWSESQIADYKKLVHNDSRYVTWKDTDPAFAARVGAALVNRLEALQKNRKVKKIAVATHVPVFKVQNAVNFNDDQIASSYFGQVSLGKAIINFSKLSAVVSGHTHRRVYPRLKKRLGGLGPVMLATLGRAVTRESFLELTF